MINNNDFELIPFLIESPYDQIRNEYCMLRINPLETTVEYFNRMTDLDFFNFILIQYVTPQIRKRHRAIIEHKEVENEGLVRFNKDEQAKRFKVENLEYNKRITAVINTILDESMEKKYQGMDLIETDKTYGIKFRAMQEPIDIGDIYTRYHELYPHLQINSEKKMLYFLIEENFYYVGFKQYSHFDFFEYLLIHYVKNCTNNQFMGNIVLNEIRNETIRRFA